MTEMGTAAATGRTLTLQHEVLPLNEVLVMGVLNVTPDSFSDGGLWMDEDAALAHALEMVAQGAQIIDVGGESTRPGATEVPEAEELRRVIPVIERLRAGSDVAIAIDTRKPSVARRALAAGATMINDTTGEAGDGGMDRVAVDTGAAIAIMHSRGTPANMRELTDYGDLVSDVRGFLTRRTQELVSAGVRPTSIVIDPGFGFAKSPSQNLEMLGRLEELTGGPTPLLSGTSRKSFIGATLDLPEDQRLEGSLATVALAVWKGAQLIRVHDVEPTVRTVRMIEAVKRGSL